MSYRPELRATRGILARGAIVLATVLLQAAAVAEQPTFTNKEIGFDLRPPARTGFTQVRGDVLDRIKVVGLMPLDSGGGPLYPGDAEAVARIEKDLTDRLTAAGFQVVPPAQMHESRARAAEIAGNLFDPVTGDRDDLKHEQYQQLVWKDYRSRHAVDGYVVSAISWRRAMDNGGGSVWDGVTDSTTGQGAFANFMYARGDAALPALSLVIWLTDSNRQLQYEGAGGLHLLMYLRKPKGLPVDYAEVALGSQMLSPQRVARAMNVIFDPLVKSPAQLDEEQLKRKGRKDERYSLEYAPAIGDRAADGSEFISADDFRTRYKSILMLPLRWNSAANTGTAARDLEKAVTERLTAADKSVIPSERVLEALQRQLQQQDKSKASYDGRSGAMEQSARDAMVEQALADVARTTPFDAVIQPTIVIRPALFEFGEAQWLGTRQMVSGDATAMEARLSAAATKLGSVPALALQLRLSDPAGKVLYEDAGGIELTSFLRDRGFVARSDWELLADKQRNAAAADFALRRLLPAARK